jgi:hypothetical protein
VRVPFQDVLDGAEESPERKLVEVDQFHVVLKDR